MAPMNETENQPAAPGYWPDAVECWRRLPNKAFFFTLLAAWLALFQFQGNSILGYVQTQSLFVWLYGDYNNPNPAADDGPAGMIPFLVIGLFWWKRKTLLALPLRIWWPGMLFLLAASLLHLLGYIVQQPRFSVLALFLGIFGLMGLAWGRAWLKKASSRSGCSSFPCRWPRC